MCKTLLTLAMMAMLSGHASAQTTDFARGADVSWSTEMEAGGKHFYDSDGRQTELMQLLHSIGMNAVRLRVWVNPETEYGAWCDRADVLAKARRAKAAGLDVMIDFHYSDFFADPGRQTKPSAWSAFTYEQTKTALAAHTRDVLSALKAEGIEPRWVQVGNETRNGMVFDAGRIDWSKSGAGVWSGYVGLSNAGYDAVKEVLPSALVIVHIDKGHEDNTWFYRDFKKQGGRFDAIGLSHYPAAATWQTDNSAIANRVTQLANTFNVPVLIVETGFFQSQEELGQQVMQDLFDRMASAGKCKGIFYWEPELYGWWKPADYVRRGWNAYDRGAFTTQGRPGKMLLPFGSGVGAGIGSTGADLHATTTAFYDLGGRALATPPAHGLYVKDGRVRANR